MLNKTKFSVLTIAFFGICASLAWNVLSNNDESVYNEQSLIILYNLTAISTVALRDQDGQMLLKNDLKSSERALYQTDEISKVIVYVDSSPLTLIENKGSNRSTAYSVYVTDSKKNLGEFEAIIINETHKPILTN